MMIIVTVALILIFFAWVVFAAWQGEKDRLARRK